MKTVTMLTDGLHMVYRCRTLMLLTLFCLVSRLMPLSPVLEGWDSVDFALALDNYDIKHYQPHFPGYPVYIFLSWLCRLFVHDPVTAVILPGAVLGSLTLVPLYLLARHLSNHRVATLTALLYVVNPACWLQAEKAFSDASGLFFVMAAAYMLYRSCRPDARSYHLFCGSLLLGLGFGVRLSYAPLLLSWAGLLLYLYWQRVAKRSPLSDGVYGLIVGVCVWLAPQLALTGGIELLYDGLAFTSGHFLQWGGTLVSSDIPQHPQWVYRVVMFAWGFLAYSLGFWWTDTAIWRLLPSLVMLIALGLCCRHLSWRKTTGLLLLYTLPYGLWIAVGQHADQPRHLLPLIPVTLVILALGLEHLRRLSAVAGNLSCVLLLLGLGILSTRLVVVHRLTPPPQLQVLQYVTRHFESPSTRLYAWGTRRMFAFYAPTFDVRQRHDLVAAQHDLDRSQLQPAIVLVTSDVQGVATSPYAYLVQHFERDRYVHHPHWQMDLYRWFPPGYATPSAAAGR